MGSRRFSFYPASYLLERGISFWLAWAGPFVAAVLMIIGYWVWLFGLRHYASTGRKLIFDPLFRYLHPLWVKMIWMCFISVESAD